MCLICSQYTALDSHTAKLIQDLPYSCGSLESQLIYAIRHCVTITLLYHSNVSNERKKTVEKNTWKIIIIEHFKYCDVIYSLKAINLLRASFPLLFHSFHSLMCYVHCAVVCVRSLRIL